MGVRANRLTPSRVAVLDVLRSSNHHPTAAELFRLVRRRRPGVAYATIYNALTWLKRNGMVSELRFGDGASRYDPIVHRHDHLVCARCGALANYTVELPRKVWAQAGRRMGFRVDRYRLELIGLCGRCSRNSAEESSG